MAFIQKLIRDKRGQDLAEYGIALAIIGAGAAIAAIAVAGNVNKLWSLCQSIMDAAAASV